jgi:hypothetical protein
MARRERKEKKIMPRLLVVWGRWRRRRRRETERREEADQPP